MAVNANGAQIPNSNLTGLPEVTTDDLKSADPARLNRILRLLASQVQGVQRGLPSTTTITNITTTLGGAASGTGGGGGGTGTGTRTTLQDTHGNRLTTYQPASYAIGTQFYETDRTVVYLNYQTPATTQVWKWISGTMLAPLASRPSDLGVNDVGFLFYANDIEVDYRWDGANWTAYAQVSVIIRDTHARRLSNYPAPEYPLNSLFDESDRHLIYIARTTFGKVDVAGANITWRSGDMFSASDLTGAQIVINGVTKTVNTVTSPTALTVTVAFGAPATNVDYSVNVLQWCYMAGEYPDTYANIPSPVANDIGMQFYDTTHNRLFVWTYNGAAPASTSPGWVRGHQELPTGYIGILPFGGTGWVACDNTSQTITRDDASTTTVTTPHLQDGAFTKGGTTGSYSPSKVAATVPTISGRTEDSGTGDGVSTTTTAVQSGVGTTVVTGVSLVPGTHNHNLTSADAPIALPADPVPYVIVPFYMKQ